MRHNRACATKPRQRSHSRRKSSQTPCYLRCHQAPPHHDSTCYSSSSNLPPLCRPRKPAASASTSPPNTSAHHVSCDTVPSPATRRTKPRRMQTQTQTQPQAQAQPLPLPHPQPWPPTRRQILRPPLLQPPLLPPFPRNQPPPPTLHTHPS
ncbi:hypothetical protein BKA81DRAFT_344481 [Phyllosticta paracitricarpa]